MENLNFGKIKEMWQEVQKIMGEQIQPRILVGGKTGVGKSSVLNALLGKNVYETGVLPTTRENNEEIWKSEGGDIVVVDVPGFGEAQAPNMEEKNSDNENVNYEENIRQLANLKAHMYLQIIKADDRALEKESQFLKNWNQDEWLAKLPMILIVNQIDKMTPVREWDPKNLNLKTPVSEKEKNIRTYLDYISTLDDFIKFVDNDKIIPFSAGEKFDDPYQYGVTDLKKKIYQLLPDSAKTLFARATELKKQEASRIIKYYAGLTAAAVGANFMPGSDAFVIAPIQIAMIVHLGKLHDLDITAAAAAGILTSLGMSFAGRFVAQGILSFFPGLKNLVGPPLAFGLTYSMGLVVNDLLGDGKLEASEKELKDLADKYAEAGKEAAKNSKV